MSAPALAADPEAVGECWLVWALTYNRGAVVLLAVDTAQSVADRHRRFALTPPNDYVRVYIERAKTNHLYGETIFNERNPTRAGSADPGCPLHQEGHHAAGCPLRGEA